MAPRLTSRFMMLEVALLATLACGSESLLLPGGPGLVGAPGGGAGAVSVAGTWSRKLIFLDDAGYAHSSETRWNFAAGGDALRMIITSNYTLGVADTTWATAVWSVDASRMIIDFTAPNPGRITLEYRIDGALLYLAGQAYQRVP